ncbi:MAG: immune inhibitor A [Candidatus Latescibacterota bacterium]|nr:MAG: immune inhibitor A [Candidatus Latescibacterota bacterium]
MPTRRRLPVVLTLFVFVTISLAGLLYAADGDEYLVRIPLKSPNVYKSLVERDIEVLAFNRDGLVDVLANSKQLDYLLTLVFPISVMHTPDMMPVAAELDDSLGMYHTYGEMESVLTDLETNYPDLADLDVMGTSLETRNIYVLKISDNVLLSEGEPEVLIMGCHHAREIMSVDVPLRFAVYLLENYGIDPVVTDMVDNREIYIAPMINPDGHVYVQHNHSGWWGNWWRKNRRDNGDGSIGVDLNRNYGYMWGYDDVGSSPNPISDVYRGTGPFSEPETQVVRDFCQSRRISVALSYHTYGELLLYPWAYAPLYTDDHDLFLAMGDSLTSTNGYFAGNLAMGAIYPVNGDTDDWAYGETIEKDRFFCFTPEMNSYEQGGFGPPDTLIQPTFDLVLPMNMLLLQLADNPYRVLPPYRPTLYPIGAVPPAYRLEWSANDPADPNPVVGYDVLEFKNLGWLEQDPAESQSNHWVYDGFSHSTARSYEGSGSYYSGAENYSSHTMQASTFYRVLSETDSLTCHVWYDIETHWDYAYLEVSSDGGLTWETVPGNLTTNDNPNGNNRGNGITGSSPGWVLGIFPLTQYLGEELELRFNYVMDASVLEEGLYIDLPGPVPTYEERTIVASGIQDTTLTIVAGEIGDFTYRVRALDAENQKSLWSNSQTITIDDLTAVGDAPRLVSRLGPNYPNPFNPVTRIPYTVGTNNGTGRSVRVHLGIYNVAGERVATVVNRELPPGAYEAVWRGTSDAGNALPSGVYFARLNIANKQTLTRKLVLLK